MFQAWVRLFKMAGSKIEIVSYHWGLRRGSEFGQEVFDVLADGKIFLKKIVSYLKLFKLVDNAFGKVYIFIACAALKLNILYLFSNKIVKKHNLTLSVENRNTKNPETLLTIKFKKMNFCYLPNSLEIWAIHFPVFRRSLLFKVVCLFKFMLWRMSQISKASHIDLSGLYFPWFVNKRWIQYEIKNCFENKRLFEP